MLVAIAFLHRNSSNDVISTRNECAVKSWETCVTEKCSSSGVSRNDGENRMHASFTEGIHLDTTIKSVLSSAGTGRRGTEAATTRNII